MLFFASHPLFALQPLFASHPLLTSQLFLGVRGYFIWNSLEKSRIP
nr:hypothetical protein [uncultured Campylobacter sp.]